MRSANGDLQWLGNSGRTMKGIFRTIEEWASASEDRVMLLLILVWAGFGVFVLLSILTMAWITLPPGAIRLL
jgi:hypothetical protein